MATTAQVLANTANAQFSTGPVTPDGKIKSARNATTHGLFSQADAAEITQSPEYSQLRAQIFDETSPEGTLQQGLAEQIARALFRLRRIDQAEDRLLNLLEQNEPDFAALEKLQASIDRARTQYQRLQLRAIAELRRLQTIAAYDEATGDYIHHDLVDTPKFDQLLKKYSAEQDALETPEFDLTPSPAERAMVDRVLAAGRAEWMAEHAAELAAELAAGLAA